METEQEMNDMANAALLLDQEIEKRVALALLRMLDGSGDLMEAALPLVSIAVKEGGNVKRVEGGLDYQKMRHIIGKQIAKLPQPDSQGLDEYQRQQIMRQMAELELRRQEEMNRQMLKSSPTSGTGVAPTGAWTKLPSEEPRNSIFSKLFGG